MRSDGSTDLDATLRGKPVSENDEGEDHSGGEASEPSATSVDSDFVERRVGNIGAQHGTRGGQSM